MDKKVKENNNIDNSIMSADQLNQFKSFYYLLKGKRDTDIKLFDEYKQFSLDDIKELNNKVNHKLSLHDVITNMISVTIGLRNKEILSFGNWNEFINYDWQISSRTKYIAVEWDFNIILPNQNHDIPQTHTLKIRIGNELNPSEMIQIVFNEDDEYEYEESQSIMCCKIDFVNNQICNELKNIVTEWFDALPNNSEDQKLVPKIVKYSSFLQQFINVLFLSSSIIFINFYYTFIMTMDSDYLSNISNNKIILFSTSSILLIYIFYQIGIIFSERMLRRYISKLSRNPLFEITKGDLNRLREVKDINKRHLKGIIYSIITGVLINCITVCLGYTLNLIF